MFNYEEARQRIRLVTHFFISLQFPEIKFFIPYVLFHQTIMDLLS